MQCVHSTHGPVRSPNGPSPRAMAGALFAASSKDGCCRTYMALDACMSAGSNATACLIESGACCNASRQIAVRNPGFTQLEHGISP